MKLNSAHSERAISGIAFKPWRLLGFGYYQAWIYIAVLSTVLFPQPEFFVENAQLTRQLFSLSIAVCLVCLVFISYKLDLLNKRHYLLFIAATLSAIGTVLIAVPFESPSIKLACTIIGILTTGFGNSFLIIGWGMKWSKIDVDRMCMHLLVSNVFAGCLYLIIVSLPTVVAIAVTALLPVLSVLTLQRSVDEPDRISKPKDSHSKQLLYKAIAAIAIIPLVFGVARALSTPPDYSTFSSLQSEILTGMTILSALVAILVFLAPKGKMVTRLYRFVIPLMAIGFLALPFLPNSLLWMGFAAIMCGFYSFEGLVWLLQPEYILRTKASVINVFGWGRVLFHLFGFIGVTIGFFLIDLGWWNDSRSIMMCIGIVIILIATATYIFTEHDLYLFIRPSETKSKSMHEMEILDEIGTQYGLSKREQEILSFLAKGRSAPFIADELYLAKGTVKVHTRHIYEKLDVHDKQELLNLIESYH